MAVFLASAPIALRPPTASAHPLGNFTINRYSGITVRADQVDLRYVVDMAEIPAFQEMARMDLDRDDEIDEREREAYLEGKVEELSRGLYLTINDSRIQLEVIERELTFLPGQGGLPTLRLSVLLRAPVSQRKQEETRDLFYRDVNYAQRIGWKEIVVQPGQGVSVVHSTVPQTDRSNQLRSYPEDMLKAPPNLQEARSTFVVVGPGQASDGEPDPFIAQPVTRSRDVLGSLVTAKTLSLPVIVLALMVALGLGALHAASPGHGKTIMAAYLVGTRGTAKHALVLGFTVTISHTLGVLGLGLVVLYASRLISPERLYPWLGLFSGAIIIFIGMWLLGARLRGGRGRPDDHRGPESTPVNRPDPHAGPGASSPAGVSRRVGREVKRVLHGDSHAHNHGLRSPAHDSDGRLQITWKTLTALGIVGGLLPSASALIILLTAISLHRVGFGLLLILAFSAGMAAVLAGAGLLLVHAGRTLERVAAHSAPITALAHHVPLITSLIVLGSGVLVTSRAALQISL